MSKIKRRTRWPLVVAAGMATFSPAGFAQGTSAPAPTTAAEAQAATAPVLSWDVVSVKPVTPGDGPSWLKPTRDGLQVEGFPVQELVKFTFRINDDSRILGAPGWMKEAHYRIEAKVSGEDVAAYAKLSKQQRSLMLQQLLGDRFKMKFHRETRDLPIYALVVAKGGSKLKEPQPGEAVRGSMWSNQGKITAVASSLELLPGLLTNEVGRPVVDKTGLTGKYDFTLRFAEGPGAAPDPDAPSIFTAVEEQLGLKLEPSKAPVEVLVIDHIEKPSEN